MDFREFLKEGKHGHLVGVGGVSMSPLAEVLSDRGLVISGSDTTESERTTHLRERGIRVIIGHKAESVTTEVDFVVRTAAVHDDNPEITRARELNIPVFERTQAWGAIMRDYENALCISGTHGKTTTTSMCTHILMAAEKDPTVMIGATLPLLKAAHRVGKGNTIVMESCEYCDSFLQFFPTVAVILNVEEDHLDYFKDIYAIKKSFRRFAELVPEDGYVVANLDDINTMDTVKGIDRKLVTFGMSPKADVTARNITRKGCTTEFDLVHKGETVERITLHVPGDHNIMNALAAAAACFCLGLKPSAIKYGLADFTGAGRRFEFKGKYNGVDVYDDYAHHPSEIKALLNAIEELDYKRYIVVFQPHTYTRTRMLFDDFVTQLRRPDVLYLAEIFAARETNTLGVSSADLAEKIDGAKFFKTFGEIEADLRREAQPGDLIVTVGAGNVYKIGEYLCGK